MKEEGGQSLRRTYCAPAEGSPGIWTSPQPPDRKPVPTLIHKDKSLRKAYSATLGLALKSS